MVRIAKNKKSSNVSKLGVTELHFQKPHEFSKPIFKPICKENFKAYLEKYPEIIERVKLKEYQTLGWLFS